MLFFRSRGRDRVNCFCPEFSSFSPEKAADVFLYGFGGVALALHPFHFSYVGGLLLFCALFTFHIWGGPLVLRPFHLHQTDRSSCFPTFLFVQLLQNPKTEIVRVATKKMRQKSKINNACCPFGSKRKFVALHHKSNYSSSTNLCFIREPIRLLSFTERKQTVSVL
jgi:hypothetical protein